jgi:hypothetical protein
VNKKTTKSFAGLTPASAGGIAALSSRLAAGELSVQPLDLTTLLFQLGHNRPALDAGAVRRCWRRLYCGSPYADRIAASTAPMVVAMTAPRLRV